MNLFNAKQLVLTGDTEKAGEVLDTGILLIESENDIQILLQYRQECHY